MASHGLDVSTLCLYGGRVSYVLLISEDRPPTCGYWGTTFDPIPKDHAWPLLQQRPVRGNELDEYVPLDIFPQLGLGFWGHAALMGHRGRKHWAAAFRPIEVDSTANRACITLRDPLAQLGAVIEIEMHPTSGVLRQRTQIINEGHEAYELQWCAAASFALPDICDQLVGFRGAWIEEWQVQRFPWVVGIHQRDNGRGRTSHDSFPGLMAAQMQTTEHAGCCYAFHLGYSGNHRLLAEHTSDGRRQIQLGQLLMPGEIVLAHEDTYTSPWAYAAFSDRGFNQVSQSLHGYVRDEVLSPAIRKRPRPIHLNTWEAVYFRHRLPELQELAERAADLGIERFVLDDGWFAGRSNDEAGLGDWWPDADAYPQGLTPLAERVIELGMEFGLWVEPEMVNPKSELYRQHPDWVLHLPQYPRATGRHQLVLDLSREEVQRYLLEKLDAVLTETPIGYLKWDMNRDLTAAGRDGMAAFHHQVDSLYRLIDQIKATHPGLEIESCASGGGRADYEILRRTERFWASDTNDALSRQLIQRGCSYFFPLEVMGSHIGAALSHTTGRTMSIYMRAHTAFFGHMGIEADLRRLDNHECAVIKQIFGHYKRLRAILHTGVFWRLESPDGVNRRMAHGVVSHDRTQAIFGVYQLGAVANNAPMRLHPRGLHPDANYRVFFLEPFDPSIARYLADHHGWTQGKHVFSGAALMDVGLNVYMPFPQTSLLIELTPA